MRLRFCAIALPQGVNAVPGGWMKKNRKRRITWLAAIAALVLIVTGLIYVPAVGAFACPACYGLQRINGQVYMEKSASPEQIAVLLADLDMAENRVAEFYRTPPREPVLLVCVSQQCDRRLGGKGARALTFGDRFIHVSPRGQNAVILAHELAHIELHARIGMVALLSGKLPAWFDEGLAVIISQDDRAVRAEGPNGPECSQPDDGDLPNSLWQWAREAGSGERPIYELAACRVHDWLDAHPQANAVSQLASDIRAGKPFAD